MTPTAHQPHRAVLAERDQSPSTRAQPVVLVGTPQTIPGLEAMLACATKPLGCVGIVLLGPVGAVLESKVPVETSLAQLASLCERAGATGIIASVPSEDLAAQIREQASTQSLKVTFVPTVDELLAPESIRVRSSQSNRRAVEGPIDLAALVGRKPHEPDAAAIASIVSGKRVLVTGAGGSIGSELSRLCAAFEPAEIALIERSENALFEIDRQLAAKHPLLKRRAILHDVVDSLRTRELLDSLRPDVVLHSAAHKHVPLMEDHPAHAVTNNVLGTRSIADAAVACGAGRFVMISSDKAVNPTSVMGATKRLAELYVQGLCAQMKHEKSKDNPSHNTRLSMVRFGNVLGSSASVLQIWSAQLAEGGPITVTDPRMTRYFMTIPEAAALVMQAASIDAVPGAGVYVLDMGEPVRILDLAQRFVRRHGFNPRVVTETGNSSADEIEILVVGSRPGEKIHEELAYRAEQLTPTRFPGINAWIGSEGSDTAAMIADLQAVSDCTDPAQVVEAIRRHVPQLRSRAA
jgi:UDP-N-acetylglucosamine 4,6-dehydratase